MQLAASTKHQRQCSFTDSDCANVCTSRVAVRHQCIAQRHAQSYPLSVDPLFLPVAWMPGNTKNCLLVADPKVMGALNVLLKAFEHDTVSRAMVGGRNDLKELTCLSMIRAGVVGGQFYVALNDDGVVVGTANWYPPGADFLGDEKQKEQGMNELFEKIQSEEPALYEWWITTFGPALAQFADDNIATYPGEKVKINNYSLYSLGVLPEYQGRGVGKLLMRAGENQAKALNVKAILEAEADRNVAIYTKLGYKKKASKYVDGPVGTPGFPWHLMVKSPEDIVPSK